MSRTNSVILVLVISLAAVLLGCQTTQESVATQAPATTPTAATLFATPTQAPAATTPSPATTAPRRGGAFRSGFPSDIPNFDPHTPATSMQHGLHAIYDRLLSLNANLELVPELAESWTVAPDGLSITLKLRKGVKFQDGTDFDAKAAKYAMDRVMTIQPKASALTDVEAIKEAQVIDDSTLKLQLKSTSGWVLFGLAEMGGMIMSPAAVEKWGKDYGLHPVGAGPYELVEWVKNDHYTLKRFDGYWNKDKAGFFDQITYQVMPDDSTRLAAFRAGQLDYVDTIPVKDIPALQSDPNVVFQEVPGWGFYYIKLHNGKPPFDNKPLRQAMSYAIDRDAIIKTVFQGHGLPAKGPLSPTTWAYKEGNVEGYGYSPEKAKQKLAEAGYPNGLKIKLLVPTSPEFQQEAQVIQAQLAKVGIESEIELKDVTASIAQITQGDYQAFVYRWTGYIDPHRNLFQSYHSKGTNTGRSFTPESDVLLEKAAAATDTKERAQLYQQAEKVFIDNAFEVWTMYYMENMATKKNVRGLKAMPSRYYTTRFFTTAWFAQ